MAVVFGRGGSEGLPGPGNTEAHWVLFCKGGTLEINHLTFAVIFESKSQLIDFLLVGPES